MRTTWPPLTPKEKRKQDAALSKRRNGIVAVPATGIAWHGGRSVVSLITGELAPVVPPAPGILNASASSRSPKSEIDEVANIPSSARSYQ